MPTRCSPTRRRCAARGFVLLAVKAHQTEGGGAVAAGARAARARSSSCCRTASSSARWSRRTRNGAAVVPAVDVDARGGDGAGPRAGPRRSAPHAARRAGRARRGRLFDGRGRIELVEDFATEAWRKLAVNAVAGLMALSRRRAAIYRRDDIRGLARALAAECLAVARAGRRPARRGRRRDARLVRGAAGGRRHVDAGRPRGGPPLEWDARNGVVARLGAQHGVPTPISDVIVPLLAAASG